MELKNKILKQISLASGLPLDQVSLDFPENESFGDYSSNIALQGKKLMVKGKSPREFAQELKSKLEKSAELTEFVEKIEVAGAGFINFWLKNDVLVDNLIQIGKETSEYGKSGLNKGKKIVLEFTDPNPFKEFHIGHVYTNTVGESLSRILEATGADVRRVNYQGDIGLHVAKAVWGMQKKMEEKNLGLEALEKKDLKVRTQFMGESYALGSKVYEEDEGIKKEINLLNKKIFENDSQVKQIYVKGRKWSLEYFETIYKRLGTKFDFYYFESEVGPVGEKIVRENLKKGIFKESQGAIIFPGSEYNLHDRVFINSLGLPTYEAKELGLAPTKYKDFAYDQSIIITGDEIKEYFKVLIQVMSLIYPELGQKTLHIGHGMVRLPEGKMSSRTGKIVTGESLLDEVKSVASEINEESSEMVSVAAVKYAFLKVGIGKNIIYDIKESLALEGNSGPYLQYTIARCNSVLNKSNNQIYKSANKLEIGDTNPTPLWKLEIEEELVLRSLSRFSEIIATAAKSYSPNILCNYLYDLAQKYNGFYNKYRILDDKSKSVKEQESIRDFRLALTFGVGQILKNGLNLLGIQAPERM